nr:MAG TPA: hypothetical protein [Caudoviricetes sp.]
MGIPLAFFAIKRTSSTTKHSNATTPMKIFST